MLRPFTPYPSGRDAEPDPAAPPKAWHASWVGKGLFAIALVFFMKEAQPFLAPVVIAIVLTFVLAAPVRALRRRGIPEALGATLLVAALLGAVALLGTMLVGPATQWLERAPGTLSDVAAELDRLRASIPLLAAPQSSASAAPAPRAARAGTSNVAAAAAAAAASAVSSNTPRPDPLKEKIASEGFALGGIVIGHALSFSLSAAATVILLFCLLASEHWMLSRTMQAIPRRRTRAIVLAGVRAAQNEIGHFLVALSIINLGVALVTTAAMTWIGLPNPVLWGTLAGVLNFIPYLGPLMISVLLLMAGLASTHQLLAALAPPACFLAIHAVEANLISPVFVGRRLSLSPISVFLSVMFWGWLWGIAGALIAVPVLVGIRSVCRRNRRLRLLCVYLDANRSEPPSLRSLLRIKRRAVPPMPTPAPLPPIALNSFTAEERRKQR
jgi:predicted PurR-regulated permease PerM